MENSIKTKIVLNLYKNVSPDLYVEQYGHELCVGVKPSVDSSLQMYRLHYIKKGKCTLFYNGQKIILKRNSFFILVPNSDTHYSTINTETELYWVAYNGYMADSITETIGLTKQAPYTNLKTRFPIKLFTENFGVSFQTDLSQNLTFQKNLLLIFQTILNENQQSVQNENSGLKNENYYVNRVVEITNQNLSDPNLSLRSIASQLHIHPNYLSNLFKAAFNIPFTKYITWRRIEYAVILMERGHTKVNEIAHEVGFNDQYFFSKTFKKICGVPPIHTIKSIEERKKNINNQI